MLEIIGTRAVQLVHTDITDVSKALSVLGFFIVGYGLISYVVKERLYLSEPLIAVTAGIITGPYVLGWVDPLSWGDTETTNYMTYQLTRIVIGVQVLFCGISLPAKYLPKNGLSLSVLLILVMTCAWFTSALLIWGIIPGLSFLESLCLAAAVTPTDPVLANSITKGRFAEKHVPVNVRNILVAESGANDGLGFPFMYLAIYLIQRLPGGEDEGLSVGDEIGRWGYSAVLYQIGVSIAYGAVVGYIARKTLKWAEARQYIDKDNFFAYGLGLALFVLGTTGLFGSDDILACFICGNSFTYNDWFRLRTEDNDTQDILDMLLNTAVFIYIGAIIDWKQYVPSGNFLQLDAWRVIVLSITLLILRRPPWVISATKLIPALTNLKESSFAGWFGPIGVSSVFYIQVALRELPEASERLRAVYAPVVLFIVFASILCHGITVPVSKLGPSILRRTTTLTQTRSITFTSRPSSRVNSITEGGANGRGGGMSEVREVWNPFFALWDGLVHCALFWRKDSFWRKPPARKTQLSVMKGKIISAPTHAQRQHAIEDESETDRSGFSSSSAKVLNERSESASDEDAGPEPAASRVTRPPPPAMELPTSMPTKDGAFTPVAAPAPDAVHPHASRIAHVVREFQRALEHELTCEREAAVKDAAEGCSAEIRAAIAAKKAYAAQARPTMPASAGSSSGDSGSGGFEMPKKTSIKATPPQTPGIPSVPGTPSGEQRSIRFTDQQDLLKGTVARLREHDT
ncbi:hypothetical protein K437DRAFT_257997 [Tilletiaria anomala UBC 951]|uniref:Cation/H+ exchanger transmembrane domain-containing protein n=1 Tax=Tilletiaria anomala (strain ATCC 24038 / CBS 436.72 / UBC 951) TaxID=1037660 RepID=A0A066VP39_TILAU|nr:uncharacterized protein K437DRAFT_257997 [Tilletiaria anomala UBC 951]KDN42068.1 hypothetical protein K437DRAFT_257997 [Tilletiaria anomala UBC 951]